MTNELAFVLINPYPIRKSRTGGILARYLARTDLKLVGARMVGASAELAEAFAAAARKDPATVAIIRPAQGAPQWAVQRAADLGNAAGLHCLPFPAR